MKQSVVSWQRVFRGLARMLVGLGLIANGSAAESRFIGTARALAPTELGTVGLNTNGSAGLFVGVNEFGADSGLPNLSYAVDDAVLLAQVFVVELGLLPPGKVTVALGGKPGGPETAAYLADLRARGVTVIPAERQKVLTQIRSLAKRATDPRGLVVVSLSTHGFERDGGVYLMPEDGTRELFADDGIALNTIKRQVADMPAGKKLIIYDACRREVTARGPGMSEALRRALMGANGFGLLASCGLGEVSWEDPELKHGIFTHFLVEGLRGAAEANATNGLLYLDQIFKYADTSTRTWVRGRKGGELQTPWFEGPEAARGIPLAANNGVLNKLRDDARAADDERKQKELAHAQFLERRRKANDLLFNARQKFPQDLPAGTWIQVINRLEAANTEVVQLLLDHIEVIDLQRRATIESFVAWWQQTGSKLAPGAVGPAPTSPEVPAADAAYTNSLGMVFVTVPGVVPRMSLWETRVRDFRAFTQSAGYDARSNCFSLTAKGFEQVGKNWNDPGFAQSEDHPVSGVSWEDAVAFCKWLTERERKAGRIAADAEYRLPTDAEWSGAAGKAKYPWGEAWPPPEGAGNYAGEEARTANWPTNYAVLSGQRDRHPQTAPVGSYLPNTYGLYDLGGNTWEWVQEWYQKEMNSSEVRKTFPAFDDDGGGRKYRVLRGGSWVVVHPMFLSAGVRYWGTPDDRNANFGFRCVLGGGLMR